MKVIKPKFKDIQRSFRDPNADYWLFISLFIVLPLLLLNCDVLYFIVSILR